MASPPQAALAPAVPAASHGPTADEIAAFKAADAANSAAGWQIFKRNYPNSAYATTADIRLASLEKSHVDPAVSPAPQPTRGARSDIDPAVIGNFEADSVVDDYDTHVSYSITADGKYRLVTTEEESGTYRSAFGIYRTTAARTHRVRTGTFRALGTTAIEVTGPTGSAVFQPAQPGPPLNPLQPVMLGTWHATFLQGGLSWALTIQNNPDGTYHFQSQSEDSGTYTAANNQWRTTSAVNGQTNTGTYRVIDARSVEFSGSAGAVVWKRQ
jgi:hypothetical protein